MKYLIRATEVAYVHYIVEAESEEDARKMYERGEVTKMAADEHEADDAWELEIKEA